jgi:hypothetical protein
LTANSWCIICFKTRAQLLKRNVLKSTNYGGDIQVTYAVEVVKKGTNLQHQSRFCTGNQVSVTVEAMNNAALALNNSFFSTELKLE